MPKANHIIGYTHTVAQGEAVAAANDTIISTLRTLLTHTAALQAAKVNLPHTNEEGDDVVHGANRACNKLRQSLIGSAQYLFMTLSRKDQEALLAEFNLESLN